MRETVVVFGAGAIGRGLLGDIISSAGYQVVFVEASDDLIAELQNRSGYAVRLVGKMDEEHLIHDYRVFGCSQRLDINKAVTCCSFAATAVGGGNLRSIAPLIAAGLESRGGTLNILVCENWPKADVILEDSLAGLGCDLGSFAAVPCSVERMAKRFGGEMDIIAEYGQTLYVDSRRWKGKKPEVDGFLYCDSIEAYYKRKLYTNNAGHALLAYLGHQEGYRYIYEALEDPSLRRHLEELLHAAAKVLVKEYLFKLREIREHANELILWRFSNRKLGDTVKRVARDPLRKLGAQERLSGLAHLLMKHGLPTRSVSRAIAAAMHYHEVDDASSVELAHMIESEGPGKVLQEICLLDSDTECHKECMDFFEKYRQ